MNKKVILNEQDDKRQEIITYMKEFSKITPLTSGNFSILSEKRDKLFIKPSGVYMEEICLDDISVVDISGKLISGLRPSVDTNIHLSVYKANNKINSIAHVHSEYAVITSVLFAVIPVITTFHADHFGKEIKIIDWSDLSILANTLAEYSKNESAVLLKQHGLFAWGSNLSETYNNIFAAEECCKIFYKTTLSSIDTKKILTLDKSKILMHNLRFQKLYGNSTKVTA
ncbi:MAG: class II aldolase/adducin family protein [Endomicrobium sp.]|jgi:L-ribulose-5-phosphate 4-epimerase|uniref:class II aldolase/adducin family protein n=1 Tax=Candidatus Endomicrobiellum cubanum TaxID=3242325 RepID=UPI002829DBDE|nr:class II aldolase/adducin family protein [Endomicrobium sp.]